MSFATSSDTTARIRILGCDPEPPRRRRLPVRHFLAVLSVLAVGVTGVAVALAWSGGRPQTAEVPAAPALADTTIGIMGSAVPAAWHQSARLHRRVHTAVTADLPAAARFAHRAQQPQDAGNTAQVAVSTVVSSSGSSGSTTSSGTGSSSTGSTGSTVVVGPELPPGPMNPGVSAP